MIARLLFVLAALGSMPAAQGAFVNWETPHVHPLALTPGGARLLAVNTADDRLEVFDATEAELVHLPPVPVGIDPVSVRARTSTEAWVVNHVSDSVSVVDLATLRVRATLDTDDEPCDVVFAGSPQRAFVSCSQANTVLVFDPLDLDAPPVRIAIDAEDPRALAVSPDGFEVYVAIFESGNGSTVLGGGSTMTGGTPPNVVSNPAGPYGGVNPPPNDGAAFDPPKNPATPAAPRVGLIVKKDVDDDWMDDNGGDWTSFVSGPQAALSGRTVGWDLPDRDVAVIDTATLSVTWVTRLMNANMALDVRASDGALAVVGTDGTNEIRFEPVLSGRFLRVAAALVPTSGPASVVDLNPHLTYATSTIPQVQRDLALGDPRGVAWNAAGTRAWVTGMGSNNLVAIDASGARVAGPIELGEGPTGIVLDEANGRAFVLDKFEAAISVVDLGLEVESARVPFFDPSPAAIRAGRKHLYDTHKNSGLGHIACASCHIDARIDRLSWDLGDPAGSMDPVTGQNLAANIPGLNTGFQPFHPMKGPMLTQTLQDIIGKEPFHWRGDRDGLEQFNPAFSGLQGDDQLLTAPEMQQYEDFLATIHFPPNPFRNFDNTLPASLPLTGHFTTGRFAPAGLPLPVGDAQRGLVLYRPPNFLDAAAVACVTCHTLPTGLGTDTTFQFPPGAFVPFPVGPNGEHHHALVAVDGSTNVSIKIPQLRNLYERTGFNFSQTSNNAGFGYLHDGSVPSIEDFVAEPIFSVASDQDVADLTAFMLAFAGSDLPGGSGLFEPPGPAGRDTHAAVGTETTLVALAGAPAAQIALLNALLAQANAGKVGLVARGRVAGLTRGYRYSGGGSWQADRQGEVLTTAALQALAAPGAELTFTAVPSGTQTRIGIDRDLDGAFDRDELDAAFDPANASSTPGVCGLSAPATPSALFASGTSGSSIALAWTDGSANEFSFVVERALAGSASFETVVEVPSDTTGFTDIGLECSQAYDYRVSARNCGGVSGFTTAQAATFACELLSTDIPRISLLLGGTQSYALEAGSSYASDIYWVIGSATGTSPGISDGNVFVPLNLDNYMLFTFAHPNVWIQGSLGLLDGAGAAQASLTLPLGLSGTLAGVTLNHGYIVLDATTLVLELASNPVPLTLVP